MNITINDKTVGAKYQKSSEQENSNKTNKEKAVKAVVIIVLLSIIIGLYLAFNIDGVKDAFINKFYTNKLERFQDEVNRDNENLFAQQQAQLDEKRKELEELEIELNARKSELELRELELQQLQEELNANKSEADSKNANIQSVVSTFENMDSDDAAKILMQYQNMNEVVQIVKNLSSSKMAEILSEMTPSFAANILQLMNN